MNFLKKGFTLIEIVVYIGILVLILLVIGSIMYYFNKSNNRALNNRYVLENANRALEEITREILAAKSIYTPTSTTNQLSLETTKHLPEDQNFTYIDFFLCGNRICLKKEKQNPIYITSDNVKVNNLSFTQLSINEEKSIKIQLTVSSEFQTNGNNPSITLTSTVTLRNNE